MDPSHSRYSEPLRSPQTVQSNRSFRVRGFLEWWETKFSPPITHTDAKAMHQANIAEVERLRWAKLNADFILQNLILSGCALIFNLVPDLPDLLIVFGFLLLQFPLLWLNRLGFIKTVATAIIGFMFVAVIGAVLADVLTSTGLSWLDVVGFDGLVIAALYGTLLLPHQLSWIPAVLAVLAGIGLVTISPWTSELVTLSAERFSHDVANHLDLSSWAGFLSTFHLYQDVLGRLVVFLGLVSTAGWRASATYRKAYEEVDQERQRALAEAITRQATERDLAERNQGYNIIAQAISAYKNGNRRARITLPPSHPYYPIASLINTLLASFDDSQRELAFQGRQVIVVAHALEQLTRYWADGWENERSQRVYVPESSPSDYEIAPALLTLNDEALNDALRKLQGWLFARAERRAYELEFILQRLISVLRGNLEQRIPDRALWMDERILQTPLNRLLDELAMLRGNTGRTPPIADEWPNLNAPLDFLEH